MSYYWNNIPASECLFESVNSLESFQIFQIKRNPNWLRLVWKIRVCTKEKYHLFVFESGKNPKDWWYSIGEMWGRSYASTQLVTVYTVTDILEGILHACSIRVLHRCWRGAVTLPPSRWLNQQKLIVSVLGARSPKSRCWRDWFRGLWRVCSWLLFSVCRSLPLYLHGSPCVFSSSVCAAPAHLQLCFCKEANHWIRTHPHGPILTWSPQ